MMLAAMVVIVLAALIPAMKQQVQRDQEEEMIHRGVQYSRAIRKYYKKFGRYPTSLDQLDNTNNLRFIRKRYKDPVNKNADFKLLHFGEVQMGFAAGIAGGVAPGANAVGAVAPPKDPDNNGQDNGQDSSSQNTGNSNAASNGPQPAGFGNQAAFGGQTFGGGPIVGVVSTSKKKGIREFNKKDRYDQWQFVYDPASDRGGLLNAPMQPSLQNPAAGPQGQQPGQSPQQGAPGVPVLTPGGNPGQNSPQMPQQPPDMNQAPQ